MPGKTIPILVTRPVDTSLVHKATFKGIELDTLSFIETTAIETVDTQQEIEQAGWQMATVVFTSMNAVEAVTKVLDGHIPDWEIYCIGYKTKELITRYFGGHSIAGTADNASGLADLLIADSGSEQVLFFCGDQRRETLPEKLKENDIEVTEIVVYQTAEIHHTLKKAYSGILFFSPSAVDSFFLTNQLTERVILFAIGTTTEQCIRKYCSNTIIVSHQPGKDSLVEQAITYFSKNNKAGTEA